LNSKPLGPPEFIEKNIMNMFLMVKTPRTRLAAAMWVYQIAAGYSKQEHEGLILKPHIYWA